VQAGARGCGVELPHVGFGDVPSCPPREAVFSSAR
jgi:hypothetical protein